MTCTFSQSLEGSLCPSFGFLFLDKNGPLSTQGPTFAFDFLFFRHGSLSFNDAVPFYMDLSLPNNVVPLLSFPFDSTSISTSRSSATTTRQKTGLKVVARRRGRSPSTPLEC